MELEVNPPTMKRTTMLSGQAVLLSVLLLLHGLMLAWNSYCHSPAYDELGNLTAGVSILETGRFGLARASPPLVRLIAAVPVVLSRPKTNWAYYADHVGARAESHVGRDFMAANGDRIFWLTTIGRWVCIPWACMGGYVCYLWASKLYGKLSGLVALVLWCTCPMILGHAALVTPDAMAAALGIGTCYAFWRWLKSPGWVETCFAGAALGVAELTSMSWIFLYALFPILWLFGECSNRVRTGCQWRLATAVKLLTLLSISVYMINLAYCFDGSLTELKNYTFVSQTLAGPRDLWNGYGSNRFANTVLGAMPVPLPRDYVLGVDILLRDKETPPPLYLNGRWGDGKSWYYYFYGWAYKVPLGIFLLICISVVLTLRLSAARRTWREETVLLAPAILFFVIASVSAGANPSISHTLPVLPFVFVFASKLFDFNVFRSRWTRLAAIFGLGWSIVSSLWVYPHSLSYFNEFAGGPANGHTHLINGNVDSGQDLQSLKQWLDNHPQTRPIRLAYFGMVDPQVAGIRFQLPLIITEAGINEYDAAAIVDLKPGWYGISANFLHGHPSRMFDDNGQWRAVNTNSLSYFLGCQPVDTIAYSIHIYHLNLAEANRLRSIRGLPILDREPD